MKFADADALMPSKPKKLAEGPLWPAHAASRVKPNARWAAAAAKCGSEDGHRMIGGSVIVAPTGEIVVQVITEDDEVITAQVDLRVNENFRRHVFDFARHRWPEHYRLITERTERTECTGAGPSLPRKN